MGSQPRILTETAKQTREKRQEKERKRKGVERRGNKKIIMHNITFIHNVRISKVLHRNFIAVLCHIYNYKWRSARPGNCRITGVHDTLIHRRRYVSAWITMTTERNPGKKHVLSNNNHT